MATITDPNWWKAALIRAFRTAAVVAIPYVPLAASGTEYFILASAFGMGFILSLITSLAGISETTPGEQPWWYAALSRVVKTVAQALVTAFGTAALFTDVDWSAIPALVVSAAVGSLLLAVVKQLPEAPTPEVSEIAAVTPVEIVAVAPAAAAEVSAATQPTATINHERDYHGV